jgi:hypothetical protein
MAIKAKTVVHQHIVDNHPHLIHTIVDASLGHQKIVEDAKVTVALGKEEADRLAAEKAEAERVAKEAADKAEAARIEAEKEAARIEAEKEAARIEAEKEAARIEAEKEAARIEAEKEAARIEAEKEAARIEAEKEAARIEAEKEAARIEAEKEAAKKAGCPVLDDANTKSVLKNIYNSNKHKVINEKALILKQAVDSGKDGNDLKPLVDDLLTTISKVSGYGTIVKTLWPDKLEKEGCLDINNPTGNGDYCSYALKGADKYDKDNVQVWLDSLLTQNSATGLNNPLDDAQKNYCAALNVETLAGATAIDQAKVCVQLVVQAYCSTPDTVNNDAQVVVCGATDPVSGDVLSAPLDFTQFDAYSC